MKSDVEVRQDVFSVLKAAGINEIIGGSLRYIPRAEKSKAEDCVISVLDSNNAQIQDCIVNVNVYVQNITSGGESVENVTRTKQLAGIFETLFKNDIHTDDFSMFLEKQRILPVVGKDEHVINNRINYKSINE
ncbi:MAG: hypothetical protein J5733_01870 [Bacteroidaceae bacterium]|nr:hypothetical protein [Bacteroidaceae bacterium]